MLNASGEGEECSTTIKNTMGQILTATYPLISLTGQTQHIIPQCQQVWWRTCAKYYNVSQFVNVFFCQCEAFSMLTAFNLRRKFLTAERIQDYVIIHVYFR